ncbi:hypothetical protein AW27_031690 [Streptomyces sp. PCS3-D2]|uniref:hypothetical protein n=1 Tax=Streptomyces sp. PCS3-D2 TaxID=1460244 RepID=UPI0005618F97|nr:hypothetical protein [Streptomyces sp. PCS3-D2]WKV75684.1 hypothetical protein AW27_031690 [Streptomyces sp. PCS3-D2]
MHPAPGAPDEDTMELFLGDMGAARPAQGPPDALTAEAPACVASPVFVDSSGRRQRRVRRWGCLLVIPAAAYVVLLLSTLMGGPTFPSPFLPSAQAPHTPAPDESAPAGTAAPSLRGTAGPGAPATPATSRSSAPAPVASPAASRAAPVTGPGPTKAASRPADPVQPSSSGRGRFSTPPGQGGGKPTGRP